MNITLHDATAVKEEAGHSATLLDYGFGEWLALDFDRLVTVEIRRVRRRDRNLIKDAFPEHFLRELFFRFGWMAGGQPCLQHFQQAPFLGRAQGLRCCYRS